MANYILWIAITALVILIIVLIAAIYHLYRKLTLLYFMKKEADFQIFKEEPEKIEDKPEISSNKFESMKSFINKIILG